ncbi:MAG: gliding motility-associated ABC transporter ATP-binding subunit GldA [Bacteroidales bacterium]|jgi:ABC-2 type transport system ATP-binding protein|nr:gliding motility-associated ABC transporter ATP-binding subunit GldA [Bacteroidales bacterium]MDD2688236.1 gliding motility-associated ABC transporter ATP-binding subunit GldA [Bacteroidales bacterium]MDD3330613.1 gliding motility-associated ABC transporter ATP-binding subunit GldA [Bacteroidales bacterium]MDD3691460.1 gliding motility-associated ABC transporter ATP-binding subunit GldA [Bacteroidales bacterium]MDD4044605.1 gliding motility-associated ABC transporter ATP-binding subunit GldA
MSIIVKNITKIYDTQKALDKVSFTVKPGEIVGLLGPNGAGKSTMMKIITCYKRQTSGFASVCDMDVIDNPLEVKQLVGYLPENNPLYLDMYVKESLAFVAGIYKMNHISQRVQEMIALTGLEKEQHKRIAALSKGYRQRVGLAHALIHDPKVLILDEPTSGLDPNQLIDIRNLIREMGKTKTVLFSTHIMQEAEAICDRVIIIDKGIIKADDSIDNLQKKFSSRFVLQMEVDKPLPIQKVKAIQAVLSVKDLGNNTYRIESKTNVSKDIQQLVSNEGLVLLDLHRQTDSMENIFHELTKN